jgi:AcrR family transcriptional regulator
MSYTHLLDPRVEIIGLIRNEPVQARSTARLAALLDAAAQIIEEIGYERLTTAMVAERAGASIGTVYRYFPDRIALLQSLAARNAERTIDRVVVAVHDPAHTNWRDVTQAVFDTYLDAFRTEPGFASIRLGDVLDLRPATTAPMNSVLADQVYTAIVERFGLVANDEARLAFEAAIEVVDALVTRAFARDAAGFAVFIDAGSVAAAALLEPHFDA